MLFWFLVVACGVPTNFSQVLNLVLLPRCEESSVGLLDTLRALTRKSLEMNGFSESKKAGEYLGKIELLETRVQQVETMVNEQHLLEDLLHIPNTGRQLACALSLTESLNGDFFFRRLFCLGGVPATN